MATISPFIHTFRPPSPRFCAKISRHAPPCRAYHSPCSFPRTVFYYSDWANPQLPKGHRFPMHKYGRVRERVTTHPLALRHALIRPAPMVTKDDLLTTHTPDYVDRFLHGRLTRTEEKAYGFPWSQAGVKRALVSAGGTLHAMHAVMRDGYHIAGHFAGGTHHAFADRGEGFCSFNDIGVAAHVAMLDYHIQRILVVDLDVHQGDGTASLFASDPRVFTFSMHGARNYPFVKQPIVVLKRWLFVYQTISSDMNGAGAQKSSLDIELDDEVGDADFLTTLHHWLPRLLDDVRPQLVIYQAGVDGLKQDALGRLALSHEGLISRNKYVMHECLNRGVKVVVCMGGGYSRPIGPTVQAHADESLSTKQELFIGSLRVHQSNRILSLHFNVTEHVVNDHFSNVIGQMRDQLMMGKTQVPPVTDATWHKMIGSPFLEHDGGQSHEADTNNSQPKIEVSSSSSESDSSDSDDNDSPFIQKRKSANDGWAIDTLDWTVRSEKEAFMKAKKEAKKGGTKTENGVAKEETGKQVTEIGLKDTEKSEGSVETSAGIDEDVVENETETPAKKKVKVTPEERQARLEEKESLKREREEERERRRVAKEEEKEKKREEREKQKYARNELKDLVQNISQQKKNVIYLRHLILNENAARRKEILDEIVKEVAGPKKIKLPKKKAGKNTDENTEPEPEPEPVVVVPKRKQVLGKPWMNAFDAFLVNATKSVRLEYMREAKTKMEEKEEKEILQKMNRRSKWEEEEKQVEAAKKTTKRGKPETQNEPKTKKGRGSKESLGSLEELEKYYQNEKAMFAAKFWDDVTVKLNALVDSYEAKVGRVAVPKLENAGANLEYRKSYTANQCKVRFNEIEQQKMISNLRETQLTEFDREAAAREVLEEFKTNDDFDPEE